MLFVCCFECNCKVRVCTCCDRISFQKGVAKRSRLISPFTWKFNFFLPKRYFLLTSYVNNGETNLIFCSNVEGVRLFKIVTDTVCLNTQFFLVDNGWNTSTNVQSKNIKVEFWSDNDKSHASAFSILDLDDLHYVLGNLINRFSSRVDDIKFAWLASLLLGVIEIEELAGDYRDTDGLLLVEAQDKANLIFNVTD